MITCALFAFLRAVRYCKIYTNSGSIFLQSSLFHFVITLFILLCRHLGCGLHLCGDDERLPLLPRGQGRLRPARQDLQGDRHTHRGDLARGLTPTQLQVPIDEKTTKFFLSGTRTILESPFPPAKGVGG